MIFLLSVKVDVNSKVKNPTLNTALHYAIKGGSEILVRHLVSGGEGREGRGGEGRGGEGCERLQFVENDIKCVYRYSITHMCTNMYILR